MVPCPGALRARTRHASLRVVAATLESDAELSTTDTTGGRAPRSLVMSPLSLSPHPRPAAAAGRRIPGPITGPPLGGSVGHAPADASLRGARGAGLERESRSRHTEFVVPRDGGKPDARRCAHERTAAVGRGPRPRHRSPPGGH